MHLGWLSVLDRPTALIQLKTFISTYILGVLLSVKLINLKIPMPLSLLKSFPWADPVSFHLIPFTWSTHTTQLLRLVLPSEASFSGQLGRPPCNSHGSHCFPRALPCNTSATAAFLFLFQSQRLLLDFPPGSCFLPGGCFPFSAHFQAEENWPALTLD